MQKTKTIIEKKSSLVVGEGQKDVAWLRCLCLHYIKTNEKSIIVKSGFGGSPACTVRRAIKLRKSICFDEVLVVVDGDRYNKLEYEKALELAKQNDIMLIILPVCAETLLLSVLEPDGRWHKLAPLECKRVFERKYIPNAKRTNLARHIDIFKLNIVDSHRRRDDNLDGIISFIET